jgi:hypothetical protein
MNLFPKRLVNICVALFILTFLFSNTVKAQTTLTKGDIAFTGYISNGTVAGTDQFSFVLLAPITANTVIKFTENAWLRNSPTTGSFRTGEGTMQLTSIALPAGTEIHILCTASPTATYSGGSAGTVTNLAATEGNGTAMSFSANGDQIIAYQGTSAAPTFISAIHMNVYSVASFPPDVPGGDPVTTTTTDWDGNQNTANASGLPGLTGSNFLTNGVDAIWIPGNISAEFDNARFNCTGPLTTAAQVRAAIYNVANWITNNDAPSFSLPTGCPYITAPAAPTFTLQPADITICAGANTSFTITATGGLTYQWQVNNGGGFTNITNDAIYSGATTVTLNITAAPLSFNTYLYRCIATNGGGSTNSNNATLTVNPLPNNPTLLAKTPATATVADGTPVSATFNAGSGGTVCADDYRYTTNGGATYLPYTPGSNISTTGVAAGSGIVFIEGRRANCTSPCQNNYQVLASWTVTPLPAAPTTLNAGDIAFSGYLGHGTGPTTTDQFSFVLLRNIGPGTVINFTNNGWLSTNVFRTGEETVIWTSPATALPAGTEIHIVGLAATKAGGGSAGTVTGTPLSLSANGDQILAYRGTVGAPTFISAIHKNVYVVPGDPVTTTAAAWDGTANTLNSSALPTGLTTGVNAIWIGTQGDINSEFDNARFGNCTLPAVAGSVAALRAALNNQANWSRSNNEPVGFTLPTNCNYLSALAPTINVTGTPLSAFTSCSGTPSTEQNFSVSGSALTAGITITAPTGFEISITSGSGFATSLTLTQSGGNVANTIIYVRLAASATGTPSGNITLTSSGASNVDVAVSGTVNAIPSTPTITAGGPTTFCAGGSVTLTSSSASGNLWSTSETTQSITVTTAGTYTVTVTTAGCTSAPSAGTTVTVNPIPPTPTITPGGPTTFCIGGSVVLTSSSATGNLWSTGETTQSITVSTAGTYTVTVTASGCTSAPSAGTTVTVNALPTTANAGPDATACISPGSFTMAANVPTVGTGSWSQAPGGPATAIIFTAGSATSNIGGLTTAGVYTFVWSITSGTCPPSRDTMTITVNTNPAPFTLLGGGTFCPGSVTLSGPVDPNYTYTWQRSLSGIANPNSFTNFGGTASTQAVTSSGNYRLIVTNPQGCIASDTTPVSIADYVFNGSLATGDATQTGRMNRFAAVSTCASPKAYPGDFTTTGARLFDSYTITNPRNVPVCATIGIASGCGVNMFSAAYSGSFNPASVGTNYLADPGSSFPNVGYYEATIPANGTIVVVVHEVNTGAGCANYQLTVNVPRETGVTVVPNTPVCSGATVNLTAPVANSYLWNPGGVTTQGITVTPIATTQYFVTLGYGNSGCTGLDSATVVVSPLPTTANAGTDIAVCGLNATLAGNTPTEGTGTWTQVGGPGTVSFSNANDPVATATATVNGTYTLRWTIATGAPCPNSSQDDVLVNFAANPSTANAGTDKTACVVPGSAAMTATAPTTGTGVWTQVAGSTTAVIVNATSPTTNITNLAGTGTYTFRWTVTNAPCPSTFDDVNVVVNGNPTPFILAGGGTFCPGTTTLTGPANPNYTYTWERSLSGIANPNSFVAFGGTAQTQAVTSSANYRIIVTNQFGCTASDTASVSMADYVFNGSLAVGDATQNGRINRFGVTSTCAAPKACPGTFTTTGARLYDAYTITNPRNVPVCATIGIASGCGVNMFSVAYSGSFDPNAPCTNYLADPGSSFPNVGYYEATIPANGTIVVVVHEVNTGTGCANYQLTVDVPRDLSPIIAVPPTVTCASTTTLTAPIANSYSWNPGGATTRSIVTPPLFVDTKFYATMGYGNVGCNRLDSITVVVTSLPPTISCPANITQSNTVGQCGRTVTYSTTIGGLPTPTESYTFTGATTGSGSGNGSGSFFNVGTTTVMVTATNACGSVNCSFTVTINDNEPPTVTTGSIASCYPTVAAAQAAALAATSATDNCPGVLTETASTVGTCSAVVTVRTTDVAGNFTDVTYNTRIDNIAPTVTVGTIASCYPTVAAAQAAALAATSATDNCPGALTEVASTVGTCSAVVTVTTTDGCGNATAVTYNTRIDNTPPVITCPAVITVCGPASVPVVDINSVTVSDNCPGAITVIHVGDVSTPNPTAPYIITRTYRATDGCGNAAECAQLITVNPIPDVAQPANQVVCNNNTTSPVNFTGTVPGTVFNWTNNTTSIGLAASGTGNIGAFTAINTGNTPVTATITVTPSYTNPSLGPIDQNQPANNACMANFTQTGLAQSFVPTTNTICGAGIFLTNNGAPSGNVTVSLWTNLPNAGGTQLQTATVIGAQNSWVDVTWPSQAVTPGNTYYLVFSGAVSAQCIAGSTSNPYPNGQVFANNYGPFPAFDYTFRTYSCGSSSVTCLGSPKIFTITVNPTPNAIATPASQTVCSATPITTIALTGAVAGTTYNWTRDNTVAVTGIAASGAGNISGILTNTTFAPVTVTFTITPTANGCPGAPITATVLVNPTPNAFANPASQTVCSGLPITTIVLTGNVTGTTFNWTRNNTATVTGIAASGAGDISGTLTNTTFAPVTVTFTITPTANGCPGTPITATVLVNPTPNAIATPSTQTICSATPITTIVLTSGVAGTTFAWTRDNTVGVTGIAAAGSGNIAGTLTNTTPLPVTVTFTITPTSPQGCVGLPITATVIVNPRPVMTALPAAQTICNGVTITPIVFASTTPGTTYTWTRDNSSGTTAPGGIQGSGSGPSITGFMINTTNAPITVTFTITPTAAGCIGTPVTATVTIQPTTTAVATPARQVSCSGTPIAAINLTSPVAGTVYSWTRDNVATATGMPASGTGNAITGTLTTTATTQVVVTFTITPSINGCVGPSIIATDTINPTPSVNTPANQVLCNGAATTAVAFTSPVGGTTFNWTNNTPSIGLAASGTGNIPSFTATNTGIIPVTATITVTPIVTSTGCTGASVTFTITVNPTANVGAVANQTLCTGATTTAINFTGTVAGTTYSWTNNTPSIGLAASGTGNIPSFTAINNTPNAVTATITVTPNTAAGCVGASTSFTITVNGQSVAPTGATSSVTANCGPTTTQLTVVGGALGTGANWRWYTGSCGGTLVGTGASITVPVNTTTTYFVRAEGTCNTTLCASVTVTINTVPTINIAAAPYTSLTPSLTTSLTATVSPVLASNTIEWYLNNNVIAGATTTTLPNRTVDQLGTYTARVTTVQGCTALSNPVVIKDSATNKLYVYPNPNKGQFKIRYYISSQQFSVVRKVVIFDSKGAIVYNQRISVPFSWGTMDINMGNVAQGDYFIKILDVNEQPVVGARIAVLR